jgi:murein L,D-transpeptidase YcbB/YkuD
MRIHIVWMNSRMTHLYSSVGLAFITFACLGSAFATPLPSNKNGSADVVPAGMVQGNAPPPSVPSTAATSGQTGSPPTIASAPPAAIVSQDPRPTLEAGTFVSTMRAAGTYKRIAEEGGWPTLPAGTVLKVGDKGPLVATLRQRLAREGDLSAGQSPGDTYDADVAKAVKRFQARHGLSESGAVRSKTLEALNISAEQRHRQLVASMKRLIDSRFSFGERYVVVNIPSATVEAVESGQVVRRYVAVVGKTDRPSPEVETRITTVNLNPTWTVPVSLIKKDIIPHVRKDPSYLAKMKIRILDAKGQEVDPQTLDWATNSAVNYTLRQDPGVTNSLGQIRIDMPNKDAVYLHDTPSKRLFAQDTRFYSSGCVRVANILGFAEWLLQGTNRPDGIWDQSNLQAAIAPGTRQDIRLTKPVPIAWVYLTGYATSDGTVHFRDDVYGLDAHKPDSAPEGQDLDIPVTSSVTSRRL